ncbi:DUF4181 domain-containing protein [Bacillus massiliigorillae]|uniref:DUF4181 domain-containing protein n=1 Tax=Bacillus massiliigorillae TaxID=1243664 RepID=UPI0005A9C9CA|nr:DUF4181 domain-containing protein [Bacillus massiliigorillae]
MPLVEIFVVVMIITVLVSDVWDNFIRKCFRLKKVTKRKEFFTKYEMWVKLFILLLFAVFSNLVGIESPYVFIVIFIFGVTFYGFEAILEKKYIENSKEYLLTFFIGLSKALILMILTVIYNL